MSHDDLPLALSQALPASPRAAVLRAFTVVAFATALAGAVELVAIEAILAIAADATPAPAGLPG